MKMKVIDRILLGVYAFASALALIALLIFVISSGATVALMNLGFGSRIIFSVLLAALISGAIYLIMMAFRPEGSAPSSSASVQEYCFGILRIILKLLPEATKPLWKNNACRKPGLSRPGFSLTLRP